MNRKTNLFYLTGNDTNFLTFSNYTDYLTSVFLNTSYKMFMSKFLAFNLPFDDNEKTIAKFKEFLMCYYENKLTILREHITTEDPMTKIHPLNYLLEAIHKFFEGQDGVHYEDMIKYKGDIVEQDYDGTYADSICIIDFNNYYDASITYDSTLEESTDNLLTFTKDNIDIDHLYGWGNELDALGTYEPKYDYDAQLVDNKRTCGYYLSSPLTLIETKQSESSQITFNCIIPLFDIFAITGNKLYDINHNELNIDISSDADPFKNVPYGIWITEHPITLYKDANTGFGQSWSLVISSKFSPFPYGVKYNGDATKDSVDKIEKYTYAQLLADQSKLYIQFQNALDKIQELQNRVNALNKSIESIATYSNIDDIREYLSKLDSIIDSKIDNQTKDIREMVNNLKWKNIG